MNWKQRAHGLCSEQQEGSDSDTECIAIGQSERHGLERIADGRHRCIQRTPQRRDRQSGCIRDKSR